MEKVIRNGMAAVLVSPGFGAGWSTWNQEHPACLYDPEIVGMVENRDAPGWVKRVEEMAVRKWGHSFYAGGAEQLEIRWVPVGAHFRVNEYDGSESIEIESDTSWHIA